MQLRKAAVLTQSVLYTMKLFGVVLEKLTCLNIFQTAANSAFSSSLCRSSDPIKPATSLSRMQTHIQSRLYKRLPRDLTCLLFQHPTDALTYRKVSPVCLVNIRLYRKALAVLVLMYKHCFLCDLTSGCHVLLQQRWLVRGPPAHSRPCFQRSTAVCCSCARACTMSVTGPQQALSAFD